MKLAHLASVTSVVFVGCVSPKQIPDGATLLAQVSYVAQPADAASGFRWTPGADDVFDGVLPEARDVPPAKQLSTGCEVADSAGSQFVRLRFYYYRVGRSGQLDEYSTWALARPGLPVERGNLVEVVTRSSHEKSRCLIATRIRSTTPAAAGCSYQNDHPQGVAAALDNVSGQATASLHCPFMEAEGWQAQPVGIMEGLAWWKPAQAGP